MNRKKVIALAFVYLVSAGIYLAFFSYPVAPASASAERYVLQDEEQAYSLPRSVYRTYIREDPVQPAILIVATVRTPFLTSGTYSSSLRQAEWIAEEKVKEEYGVDIDVVFKKEFSAEIGGHEAVMQEYEVHLKVPASPGFVDLRPDTLRMDVGAYFCRERYESVLVVYVYPPVYADDFEDVMESVSC